MKPEYRELRLNQLSRNLRSFENGRNVPRPQRGWLRAVRRALGLKLEDVAQVAQTSRQRIFLFEKAESNDQITLRSLRRIANAMDCDLVYAIVPKSGTIMQLAERKERDEATKRVLSVEHSMSLEGQAVGHVKEMIASEMKKSTKKLKR